MRLLTGIVGVMLVGAAAQASAETTRFAIIRNGEQIGTHVMEINRAGPETSVKISPISTSKFCSLPPIGSSTRQRSAGLTAVW